MMPPATIGLCILLLLIIIWHLLSMKKEHARIVPPNFRASLVDADRARRQDQKGMTVTDYVLEANMRNALPISDKVRILG